MKEIFAMRRKLTDTQVRALRFIHDYIKNKGYAPTPKEIGEALGISTNVACGRVRCLFDRDYLREPETWEYGRSIALTEKGIRACESFNDNRRTPTN